MGTIPHMNILIYHQKHLTNDINGDARTVNEKHFKAIIRNVIFMSHLFPTSRIFFINDHCHQFSKNLSDNVTLIDLNKINNPSFDLARTALQIPSLAPNCYPEKQNDWSRRPYRSSICHNPQEPPATPNRHLNFLKIISIFTKTRRFS